MSFDANLLRMKQLRRERIPRPLPAPESAPKERPIMMRPQEVAMMLRVSERTLRTWPIPRFTFGRVVGYLTVDIENFIASNRKPVEVSNG